VLSEEKGERLACVVLEPIIGNAGSISARQVGMMMSSVSSLFSLSRGEDVG
jgi:adenosylmethionine-8-amino-7-oxononanoate aminotransferase